MFNFILIKTFVSFFVIILMKMLDLHFNYELMTYGINRKNN